jgi:phage-related protein
MPQNLSTTIIISPSSSLKKIDKTLSVVYGNGYQQDMRDGINSKKEERNIVYENISEADRNTIVAVLEAAGGWDKIIWTAPGGTAKNYKLVDGAYTENRVANRYSLNFQLRQVP